MHITSPLAKVCPVPTVALLRLYKPLTVPRPIEDEPSPTTPVRLPLPSSKPAALPPVPLVVTKTSKYHWPVTLLLVERTISEPVPLDLVAVLLLLLRVIVPPLSAGFQDTAAELIPEDVNVDVQVAAMFFAIVFNLLEAEVHVMAIDFNTCFVLVTVDVQVIETVLTKTLIFVRVVVDVQVAAIFLATVFKRLEAEVQVIAIDLVIAFDIVTVEVAVIAGRFRT